MIELERSKDHKWILQKNISSKSLLIDFVGALKDQDNIIDAENIKEQLKDKRVYRGRSDEGNAGTMGVRLSQACFYMFGYKKGDKFFPTPMANLLLDKDRDLTIQQIALINLYSMQFPNPYSKTIDDFTIYVGRLLIKLLLDKRINERLYIDECIFFLMFLEHVDEDIYEELIESILEFRSLSFEEKSRLFKSVEDYDDVFSNATHEMNYYFMRIFTEFGVFETMGDRLHNDGNLFKFLHGKSTIRTDAYVSRAKYSGYVIIDKNIKEDAIKLNEKFSAFDYPLTQAGPNSRDDWIRELYLFNPLKYIDVLMENDDDNKYIIESIENMVHHARYGTRDGKSFEYSLKPVFEMFRENRNVEIISGSGDTDLLCIMDDESDNLYKVNVDAKTSRTSTAAIVATHITNHILKNGSKYCIIVSPRFAKGVAGDIKYSKIVTIEAETLADYCLNECLSSTDKLADYTSLDNLICDNLGTDITKKVNNIIEERFELCNL